MSDKVQKLVDAVKELTLMEVSELVKAHEEEFGVSAAAPMMMAGAMPAAAAEAVEEKDSFDVPFSYTINQNFSNWRPFLIINILEPDDHLPKLPTCINKMSSDHHVAC